ncbi:MAG TPA: family 10 glycosylhydrolase [Thermoanaerobaculia bacterium]|nr:family 10 glycosylhydrolase [Thermoanaerobaculia bacterium]
MTFRTPATLSRYLIPTAVSVMTALLVTACASVPMRPNAIPDVEREFRGVWVAAVNNIDWPSRRDLSSEEQQRELVAILDRAAALNFNAVILQIRPAADALYASDLEPWSEYLTGEMGKPPEPFYDPLSFAVTEAHARGLELHAWLNPYRAHHPTGTSPIAETHLSRTRPELVRQYGKYLWFDPGAEEVRRHAVSVVTDVVRRYDIDGVHLDDYFYPYPEQGADGVEIEFPDEPSWSSYRSGGGALDRSAWRRENVNSLVRELYEAIKLEKRWVKFGVSPFGIWRPGYPEQIRGLDAFDNLYADSRLWLQKGWVDYLAPQLYWPIAQKAQSYPVLLRWWLEQNSSGRHVWAGIIPSRIAGRGGSSTKKSVSANEIIDQIRMTRELEGGGVIHFSMKSLMQNRDEIADKLLQTVYARPALVPASPWLGAVAPSAPLVSARITDDGVVLDFAPQGDTSVWLWAVRKKVKSKWSLELVPGSLRSWKISGSTRSDSRPVDVAVSAVNRLGGESPVTRIVKP